MLLTIAIAVGGLAWLGVQLIVDPQSVAWLNRIAPNWVPLPVTGLKPPQTLLEIRGEITKAGRIAGSPLWLNPAATFSDSRASQADLLFPLLERRPNCSENCEQIVELRVYQAIPRRGQGKPSEQQFQLMDQVIIAGPSETVVTAPLVEGKAANPGTVRSLPLTAVTRWDVPKSLPGIWLSLEGWLVRGDRTVAYGQVLHLNPQRMRLGSLLEWSSSTGTEPQWQEVTGGGDPELVVDQTLGLEPKLRVYQVRSLKGQPTPIKLDPISLGLSAIQRSGYTDALLLARTGLWSPAIARLKQFQRDQPAWTAAAQAQRDVIQRHAQVTQAQADRTWSSPSQQALVNLLDGRWETALKIFQEKPENSQDIADLLRTDTGQIQNRVDATLKVVPTDLTVKTWGALLAAVQKGGKAGAILWLRKQSPTSAADRKKILAVVGRLSATPAEDSTMTPTGYGQLIGTAQALDAINPKDWFQPPADPPLQLAEGQAWYRVQVSRVFDGKRWRSPDDLNLGTVPKKLWQQLRLGIDPRLQVVRWLATGQPQTLSVMTRAVQWSGRGWEILALGDRLDLSPSGSGAGPRPLAFSDYAIQWFSPSTTTLADLVQQQPAWAKRAIPILARELNGAEALPPETSLDWAGLESLGLGSWSVELAPITHPTKPDVVLTLTPEALSASGQPNGKPRSLIFSANGQLLYSEFSMDAGQTYVAIATLGNNGALTLIVEGSGRYDLLRWSPKEQRFRL
jgi:hypothetical protein